jgi:hypothetical protein
VAVTKSEKVSQFHCIGHQLKNKDTECTEFFNSIPEKSRHNKNRGSLLCYNELPTEAYFEPPAFSSYHHNLFFKASFNNVLTSTPTSPKSSENFRLILRIFLCLSSPPYVNTFRPSHPLSLNDSNNICRRVTIINLLVM